MPHLGKLLIVFGIALIVIGIAFLLSDKFPWLRLGRLPGDIKWTSGSGRVRIYFPLVTSILLSLLLALIFKLLGK